MVDQITGETKDGKGAGDHDQKFEFGHPRSQFTEWQWAGVLLMRGHYRDVTHAPLAIRNRLRYGGDDDHVVQIKSGLYVPADHEPEEG